MKIAHIIQTLQFGGAETSLYDILQKFNYDNYEFWVIYFWEGDDFEDRFKLLPNITFINLNCMNRYDIRILFKLRKLFKKEKFDIIHTHLPIAGIYTRFADFTLNSKIITTQHSVLYNKNLFHKIDRWSMRRFNDYTIANSNCTKEFLLKYNYIRKEKIKKIYLGLNFEKMNTTVDSTDIKKELNIPQYYIVLGNVGSFKIQKGHKYLIEIFDELLKIKRNLILILVGDGSLREEIEKQVQVLGIEENVVFTGKRSDVQNILNVMDIYLSTSVSESFGISILEAMKMTLPVVSFKTDGIVEIIKDEYNGYIVDKKDNNNFIEKTIKLINQKNIKEKLKENIKKSIIKFSIEETCKNLDRFYENINS